MPTKKFIVTALAIREQSPTYLWESVCRILCSCAASETKREVLLKLPSSVNSDLAFLIESLLSEHEQEMTWREMGLCLHSIGEGNDLVADRVVAEIIWSGPPTAIIPVRRIDQVLYDLVQNAQQHILLVTFAASRIGLLSQRLFDATWRGVNVDLVLESESESEGQLRVDAKSAFSPALSGKATIYYWPITMRDRNESGRPGKLHAKCAVIDGSAIVSSANLTHDAFNRNMELGVLFRGGAIPKQLLGHFRGLIALGILTRAV
jgi:phosphatidylserine/phosphatidylglycerophosphate/cardiolipin synthase-like enzyme